jgi:acetoin utilization deacetylase AcuC-like enzyme
VRATEARLLVASHADCALHEPFPGHPERSRRLGAALAGAAAAGARAAAVAVDEEAALAAVSRVHSADLPTRLRAACAQAPCTFDTGDNPISGGTYRAAVAAVATCLAGVELAAAGGEAGPLRFFAAVRPPGHHATRDRAMGFCFFNNAAITAEALLARGLGPVAVVDFDLHHGNGTQDHFYARDDVFFLSLHAWPEYPGTGAGDEVGRGGGEGFTLNLPLAGGADDEVYVGALVTGVTELLRAMRPAAWVVSAGFDAHRDDPIGCMRVSDSGFGAIGRALSRAAGESPVIAVLEGGYDLKALQGSVREFLAGLNGTAAS